MTRSRRLLPRAGRPVRRRALPAQSVGWCQGAARPLADAHRRRAVAAGPDYRRGPGDAAGRARRAAPAVVGAPRQPHLAHRRARRRRPPARTSALGGVTPTWQPHARAPRARTRHTGRTGRTAAARFAEGRRRQADDAGTDRHARRPRAGQPACVDDYRRRVVGRRRATRGPSDRREAVPRDLCPARPRGQAREAAPGHFSRSSRRGASSSARRNTVG